MIFIIYFVLGIKEDKEIETSQINAKRNSLR